ncbi:sigma-54-dependent Fis family transcriptional regulator, partial [bacterium]
GEGREADLIRDLLRRFHEKLPVALQLSFVDRHDWRRWIENKVLANFPAPTKERTPMQILESLATISRELLMEDDMDRVLKHLMDAAMRLSAAENGFLVLRSEETEGPIPGFSVVVARNVAKEALESQDFAFSLSAIREAMEKGQPVVTDNALQDPRFSQAKSVQLHELKSILALPINGRRGVLGVFYLDHRFEAGLFDEAQLQALRAFADQAALALQKAQMIEELKKANAHLTDQVEEQSDQLHRMQMELAESRLKLKYEYSEIVGRSPKMVEVLSLVDKITDSRISVWIFGESGTGKESIARALHFNSGRAKQPFVAENCSALPETLMESELFGHKRGAFTHADKDKKGILEYAHRGTIFLDEIADLSLNLQAKLLRFLQEGEIRPLGSNEVVKVDVRVVSASNKDLQELVEQGKFREDLYFRLNGVTIHLPPLRERMEDLPLLVEHFLKKAAAGEGKEPCRVSMEVLRQFMNYPWPGNIRELQNTLETAALFAENGAIGLKALAFKPILLGKKKAMKHLMMKTVAKETMDPELEKLLLAIRDNGYHKGNAAQALGISRRNLYTKLEKFGVPVELKELKSYIDDKFV